MKAVQNDLEAGVVLNKKVKVILKYFRSRAARPRTQGRGAGGRATLDRSGLHTGLGTGSAGRGKNAQRPARERGAC